MRTRNRIFFLAMLRELPIVGIRSGVHPLALHDGEVAGGGGAPAGGAPAAESGSIAVMPNGNVAGQPQSAVEKASAEARERIAKGESAVPAEKPEGKEPVRASDGTFAPKLPEEVERENAEKAAQAEKERIAAEAAARGEQPPADDAANDTLVEIPVAEGEPLKIEFDDPKVAETVRERFEVAAEAERIQQEARRQLDDVLAVRESVNVDPVGFVMSEIATQPAAVEHLVLSLLTAPEHKPLLDRVAKIASDAKEVELVAREQKAARTEYANQARERIVEARAVEQNLGDVKAVVTALLPRTITPEAQRVAWADMMRDLQHYADRHGLNTIPVEDIPLVLRGRLTALGVDPMVAAQQATDAVAQRRLGKSARRGSVARPATAKAGTGAAPAAPAQPKNGSAFVASNESRKAAVIPGSGAGSPGGTDLVLPKNADGSPMSIEQTIAFHRSQLKKGVHALPQGTSA